AAAMSSCRPSRSAEPRKSFITCTDSPARGGCGNRRYSSIRRWPRRPRASRASISNCSTNRRSGWAEHMDQARRLAAEFVQSDVFHDLVVNGIAPDGTVDWPAAGIVRALREAAAQLAVEGWTPIAAAGRWIADRHPEQLPAKYGCSSWRQVVHE